jgi:hypothetical protein
MAQKVAAKCDSKPFSEALDKLERADVSPHLEFVRETLGNDEATKLGRLISGLPNQMQNRRRRESRHQTLPSQFLPPLP